MVDQALDGVKVIDLCRAGPGMMATQHLADYGADVISIQEPGYTQRLGTSGPASVGRLCRRNKRSVLLSLRSEEGRRVFYRMAERADVIMESNRPGVAQRLGVDYPTIKQMNPRIIYCSLSGFGQYGPYANIPAHNVNYEGVGGSLYIDDRGRPAMPRVVLADLNAAWNGCISILMALHYRQQTGKGQFIDIGFSDTVVSLRKEPFDRNLTGAAPGFNTYRCKDGKYLALGIIEPWFWERICRVFGKPEWIPHQYPQGELSKEIFAFLKKAFRSKSRDEWFRIFREADTQVTPAYTTWQEVAEDPHNRARDMVLEMTNPATGEKDLEPGFVCKFSETPGRVRVPSSIMGSHGDEVLAELGYSKQQRDDLRRAGVIG